MRTQRLVIDGREVASVEVAENPNERGKGLLGRDGIDGAIWLSPGNHIHTYFMRFPIDVAFVHKTGEVIATRLAVRPNRMTPMFFKARGVLEAEAGQFEKWGLEKGSTMDLSVLAKTAK